MQSGPLVRSRCCCSNSDEFIEVENAPTDLGQSSAKAISYACHTQLYVYVDENHASKNENNLKKEVFVTGRNIGIILISRR